MSPPSPASRCLSFSSVQKRSRSRRHARTHACRSRAPPRPLRSICDFDMPPTIDRSVAVARTRTNHTQPSPKRTVFNAHPRPLVAGRQASLTQRRLLRACATPGDAHRSRETARECVCVGVRAYQCDSKVKHSQLLTIHISLTASTHNFLHT
jgi:hypothetical protein